VQSSGLACMFVVYLVASMVKSRQEVQRQMYLPSPTSEVEYRNKDDGCCGIFYLKHVLYVFNFILVVNIVWCCNNNIYRLTV